jgi:hypothetical protein
MEAQEVKTSPSPQELDSSPLPPVDPVTENLPFTDAVLPVPPTYSKTLFGSIVRVATLLSEEGRPQEDLGNILAGQNAITERDAKAALRDIGFSDEIIKRSIAIVAPSDAQLVANLITIRAKIPAAVTASNMSQILLRQMKIAYGESNCRIEVRDENNLEVLRGKEVETTSGHLWWKQMGLSTSWEVIASLYSNDTYHYVNVVSKTPEFTMLMKPVIEMFQKSPVYTAEIKPIIEHAVPVS